MMMIQHFVYIKSYFKHVRKYILYEEMERKPGRVKRRVGVRMVNEWDLFALLFGMQKKQLLRIYDGLKKVYQSPRSRIPMEFSTMSTLLTNDFIPHFNRIMFGPLFGPRLIES